MEFVAPEGELERFFQPAATRSERAALIRRWFRSRSWPVAFSLAFHDDLLRALFGPAATQHAEPGSYPGYFRSAFERGLRRADAARNPFLQHVFLGRYLPREAPRYLGARTTIELHQGELDEVPDLSRYSLYSLSNVLDWSDDRLAARWGGVLQRAAPVGSAVLIRQLNNRRDVERFFRPTFTFDAQLGRRLLRVDRSLFYERILVGLRP